MYVILDDSGLMVSGYNAEHMIIQRTEDPTKARRFASPKYAERWAKRYTGAGYGLDTYKIVKLEN